MKNFLNEIKILPAKTADVEDIVNIRRNTWLTTYKGLIDEKYFSNKNQEKEIESRKQSIENPTQYFSYVIKFKNQNVGFFVLDKNLIKINKKNIKVFMSALYILQNYQRMGIGKKVFEYVKNILGQEKISHFGVWCLETNKIGMNFYQKQNGTIIGSKPFDDKVNEVCWLFATKKINKRKL